MENLRHAAWDHHAIKGAVDAVDPAAAAAVSHAWTSIGREFDAAVAQFRETVESAAATGWRGSTATAATESVARYSAENAHVGTGFVDTGSAIGQAIAGAESIRTAIPAPVDRPEGWVRAMPWMWDADEAVNEAEQSAKAAMESTYQPALHNATTSVAAVAAPDVMGYEQGPNGIHGVPAPASSSVENLHQPREVPTDSDDVVHSPTVTTGGTTGGAMAAGVLAGALGSGAAQYARHVVATHHDDDSDADVPAEAPDQSDADESEDTSEPLTFLVEMDDGSDVVGTLPPASPPVIGG
ncbi:MAG: hypothetical protein GX610_21480 [Rhodococcus sp.]|nr:hypothetical protein [Rhodococcus sp. (in: high G+C Gram-positive bacteria)]